MLYQYSAIFWNATEKFWHDAAGAIRCATVVVIIIYKFLNTISTSGSSLQCHQCNSYDSYHCADPFYYEDDETKQPKTMEFMTECEPDATLCRKIKQTGKMKFGFLCALLLSWYNFHLN